MKKPKTKNQHSTETIILSQDAYDFTLDNQDYIEELLDVEIDQISIEPDSTFDY